MFLEVGWKNTKKKKKEKKVLFSDRIPNPSPTIQAGCCRLVIIFLFLSFFFLSLSLSLSHFIRILFFHLLPFQPLSVLTVDISKIDKQKCRYWADDLTWGKALFVLFCFVVLFFFIPLAEKRHFVFHSPASKLLSKNVKKSAFSMLPIQRCFWWIACAYHRYI